MLQCTGLPAAPVHHEGGAHATRRTGPVLDDDELSALVAEVRASVERAAAVALDALETDLPEPIELLAVRAWPDDLPAAIAELRRPPHESRADSAMYAQVLAAEVLQGPRARLGPPWTKDHRVALAATIVAG